MFEDIVNAIRNRWDDFVSGGKTISPVPENYSPPTPTPTPNIPQAIRRGFREINHGQDLPVSTLSATFANEAQKNNLNPFLLPAVSVLESSGGKKETYPNNPLNWGITAPSFKPKTPQETIKKAASGIGTGRGFSYYKDYRRTGNLRDFATHYAPPSENNTERYINNLTGLIKIFEKYR